MYLYRGVDLDTCRPVAVKLFRGKPGDRLGPLLYLWRHGPLLSSFSHPACLNVHSIHVEQNDAYIVREFVQEAAIAALLRTQALPLSRLKSLAEQVAGALVSANEQRLLHGNLNPHNVFLRDDGSVLVSDLGIAHILHQAASSLPHSSEHMPYLAPEVLAGERADHRADMYSLGAILYTALTGYSPDGRAVRVDRPDLDDTVRTLHYLPLPPRMLCPAIPVEWERLVVQLLHPDRSNRLRQSADLLAAIRALPDASSDAGLVASPAEHVDLSPANGAIAPEPVGDPVVASYAEAAVAVMEPATVEQPTVEQSGVSSPDRLLEVVGVSALLRSRPLPLADLKARSIDVLQALAAVSATGATSQVSVPLRIATLTLSRSVTGRETPSPAVTLPVESETQSDLRALGMLLYAALTGYTVSGEALSPDVAPRQDDALSGDAQLSPGALDHRVPAAWDAVVDRLLTRDVDLQFSSISAVIEGLQALPDTERKPSHLESQPIAFLEPLWRSTPVLAGTSLAGLMIAEAVTAFVQPTAGVLAHIILLISFLTAGTLTPHRTQAALFTALSIAPLIRIISLGMPLYHHFPQAYWYVLTAVPLFLATYLIAKELHIPARSMYLRLPRAKFLRIEIAVAFSGIALGLVEWRLIGTGSPVLAFPAQHGEPLFVAAVLTAVILMTCTGLLEEVIFRGMILRVASSVLGQRAGLLFMALLFAILHIGWRSAFDFVFVFFVAVYFGLVVRKTKSVVGVTFAHGAINTMLFVVLPLALR
jgi:uncharacterized protein